jgi:hypothetical protein
MSECHHDHHDHDHHAHDHDHPLGGGSHFSDVELRVKALVVSSGVNRDLERFKDFIEARQRETGAWRGEVPVRGASQR